MVSSLKQVIKRLLPPRLWRAMVSFRWSGTQVVKTFERDADILGVRAAFVLALAELKLWKRTPTRAALPVWLRGYKRPVFCRPLSSDPAVIRQVFREQEYQCVTNESGSQYIIDCGANIGCTTFYLLHKYPMARAVVVEPDPDNMRICKLTLRPLGNRVMFVQAGIWSHPTPMMVRRGIFRDGAEWSIQVSPAEADERPDFDAMTVDDIMSEAGFPRIDVLKMDVEASEAEIFARDCSHWLSVTRTLVIELHGAACETIVRQRLYGICEAESRCGELTVFKLRSAQLRVA